MMDRKLKIILNIMATAVLALFLWWAQTNLGAYHTQILNLIAVNIILALTVG